MAQDPESRNSVFDFVYLDSRRIALYLAQFSQFGNLTSLVRTSQDSDQSKITAGPKALKLEASEGQQTTLQKHYDPQWIAPPSFLEELQARDMIKRMFEDVQLGDIFVLPGALSLIDLRMFQGIWKALADSEPASGQSEGSANRQDRRANNTRAQVDRLVADLGRKQAADQARNMRIMGSLDQPAFLNFQSQGRRFWAIADASAIIGDGQSLFLKHGHTVPGTWHLLAILDALPEREAPDAAWLTRACGFENNIFGTKLFDILRSFEEILGRPPGCYGVTPLAIFREVGAPGHTDI